MEGIDGDRRDRVCGGDRGRQRRSRSGAAGSWRRRRWPRWCRGRALHGDGRQQGRRRDGRRDEGGVRSLVHRVGHDEEQRADAGAARGRAHRGAAAAAARTRVHRRRRPRRGAPAADARFGARAGDDRCAAGGSARQAKAGAQGARPRQGCGVRPFLHSARRSHHRGDGEKVRHLDDDHHLRSGRRQRGEPQAVRRDLPGEHDGGVPRRANRRRRDRGASPGAARLRPRGQGARRHPRRQRLVSSESA